MGVDYNGNYGIGCKVNFKPETLKERPEDCEEGLAEFLDMAAGLDEELYEWWQTGEADYTDEDNEIYICLNKPFTSGFDLTSRKDALLKEIDRIGLMPATEFDEVGGLHVY